MATSLVKFAGHKPVVGGDQKVFWGRADRDGIPFLGQAPPMMPEEEYEARIVRTAYPQNGFFDVMNPAENKLFLEVLDCCLNQWYQLLHLERFWRRTTKHYMEWAVYYMVDGSNMVFSPFNTANPQGTMGVMNGQPLGFGHPGSGT